MKIKQCLLSFPVGVICFISILVGIVYSNNYLNNYKHQMALKQLIVSTAMLQTVDAQPENGLNKIVTNKLNQLKQLEKDAETLNGYSQIASVFILMGSILLGGIFIYNLNNITSKLNKLSVEVKNINQNGLDASNLDLSFKEASGNEIDCLANSIAEILMEFKKDTRKANFMLRLFQEGNKQLKQQLELQSNQSLH